jgi:uncharacterized protein (DUF849 family)
MRNQKEVWLEVALNGAAGRAYQPLIPLSADDIIKQGVECAHAGASIIHTHVYDEGGRPTENVDLYRKVIEGIKEQVDIIVYPTLALSGTAEQRYAPIEALASLGLLDWGVIDPGSVNIMHQAQVLTEAEGLLYANPISHIRRGLALAERDGWRPAYASYEPGFLRLGAALAKTVNLVKQPIYRFMFSDNLLFGSKPTQFALEFYAKTIEAELGPDVDWMISGLDAEIHHLIKSALDLGAHVRVGLEDAPFGCSSTNVQLVESAVAQIEQSGYRIVAPTAS